MIDQQAWPSQSPVARTGIVDCDVHPLPRNADEIRAYMPMPWRDRYRGGGRGFFDNPIHGVRLDSRPPDGGQPASNPDFLREQLINAYGMPYAILLPRAFCNLHRVRVAAYKVTVETTDAKQVETYPVTVDDGLVVLHVDAAPQREAGERAAPSE
jgi:hypothetical protein